MNVEHIFAANADYLSDVYGVDYTDGNPYMGWYDPSALFCDNVVFWCLIHWIKGTRPKAEISTYVSLIRCMFGEVLEVVQFKVSYVTSGLCKEGDTTFPSSMQTKKAKELDRKEIAPGQISVKVSFENVPFVNLLPVLKCITKKLMHSFAVMHDMDVGVDLSRISTRMLIKEYLLSIGVKKESIVNDRHSVGDNCISWYDSVVIGNRDTRIRSKLYNKFVQLVESSEVRSKLGSKLAYLVANADVDLAEKLQKYKKVGMTRLEITLYCSRVFKEKYYQELVDKYLSLIANCPTYEVSFRKQWKKVVERLTQMLVVCIPESSTFTYCHWWNSLTGRYQGLQKSNVPPSQVKVLMANLSFNDRPIHYLEVAVNGKDYSTTNYVKYRRVEGSVEITMIPGPGNSLRPFRRQLKQKALTFADVGMGKYINITLEWPDARISRKTRERALVDLEEWKEDTTLYSTPASKSLQAVDPVVMSNYHPNYKVLQEGETYEVTGYGYGSFRGKEYLCLTLALKGSPVYVRCTCSSLNKVVLDQMKIGKDIFSILVQRHKIVRSVHNLECVIVH